MVEVEDDFQANDDHKIPGEDDEPDMGDYGEEEEELVPIEPKHGGLFGADLSNVKYWRWYEVKDHSTIKH